jgi:hypothetical protein
LFKVGFKKFKFKKMKKIMYAAMGMATLFAVSCKKNQDLIEKPLIPSGSAAVLDTLVGNITTNTTVTKNTYLFGVVHVIAPATLTINPGVTIYGSQSTTTGTTVYDSVNLEKNKGTLCIDRGAKISAAGNAAQPILFTSDDKIAVGSRKFGDWGGVILYGSATFHNAAGNTTNTRFEAFNIVPNDTRNFYGGSNDADNSGIMTYVRIEFAGGVVTAPNAEVNGFTLCAVGSGTTINHIEVLKSGDDAIEWFGGAVNCDHLFTYATKDDDFDMDEGYHGTLTYCVGFRDTTCDNSGSHLIEIDNDALAGTGAGTNLQPYTAPILSNFTLIGPSGRKDLGPNDAVHTAPNAGTLNGYFEGTIQTRRRASLRLINSYIISNAMPYGIQFTPTTGSGAGSSPVAVLLDPPSLATPGNVQAWNTFSSDYAFSNYVVQSPIEGNGVGIFPGGFLPNDGSDLTKIVSAANFNNGVANQAAFNLGGGLGNTTATPGYNTGLSFAGNNGEKGGVTTFDDWLLNNFGTGKLISIATN